MKIAKLGDKPEIFYTVQGEGRNIGRPSVFIRSSLCNLHCVWCDTDYTWNWQGTPFSHVRDKDPNYRKYVKGEQIVEMSPAAIVEEVRRYPCKNVVFTGGEPLLQQGGFLSIAELLAAIDPAYFFEVETNGTIAPKPKFDETIHQYNVSPKLENSGNKSTLRERPAVYRFYAANPKAYFKYVVVSPQDLAEILRAIETYHIAHDRIYLMPEGTSAERIQERQQWLIEICKQRGFNFSDRLHIRVYGMARGV